MVLVYELKGIRCGEHSTGSSGKVRLVRLQFVLSAS